MAYREHSRAVVHILAATKPVLAQAQVVLADLLHDPLKPSVLFVVFEAALMGPIASALHFLKIARLQCDVA
jgi:hypothetical protein